ncbi:MAG: hypothetical protein KF861_04215 [Planctomycetaceae bacterium]|nr:hypothetical protein [Planctomycetaceae bacterium]
MTPTLTLLMVQGCLGAFDTLWYHEWKQQLPMRAGGRRELILHALRDFAYAVIFGSLAWFTWDGWLAAVFGGLLVFEIVVTLLDFVEEDRVRPLPPGERVMHTIMAIVYGAFLANLLPQVANWFDAPTRLAPAAYGWLSYAMTLFAAGVFLSGCRDLWAAIQSPSRVKT